MMAHPNRSGDAVSRFCYQYLQLEPTLDYPEPEILRESSTQDDIFQRLFSSGIDSCLPPLRYQLKVLKELVKRVEASIQDWDAHEVSEDLMTALATLLATPIPSELSTAQQKSYVTYHLAALDSSASPDHKGDVTLLESRSLISASGTTGLRTWEAALHLGQYLCRNREIVDGKRVLELGAGTGYLAILCAKFLGASQVIASDGSDDVINNLPESFFLNGLQDSREIKPMDLKWGHAFIGTEDQQWNSGEGTDVVLGADITYDESVLPALIGTLEELLSMFPGLEMIISATERNQATFESFQTKCRSAGLIINEPEFPIIERSKQRGPFYNDRVPIRICRITKI